MKRPCVWAAIGLLAAGLAAGCRYDGVAVRADGYLLTVYVHPRDLRPGPLRLGLRVQDPDYRILEGLAPTLSWRGPDGAEHETAPTPGPGRDYRVIVNFDLPGEYRLAWRVVTAEGKTLRAESALVIPGS